MADVGRDALDVVGLGLVLEPVDAEEQTVVVDVQPLEELGIIFNLLDQSTGNERVHSDLFLDVCKV